MKKKRNDPLHFDTPAFTRNLEAAYAAMFDRHSAGLPPDHISVPPTHPRTQPLQIS